MASNDPLHGLIAENIDSLVNLDISGYGVIADIHQAAREHYGAPLAWLAAERLRAALPDGGYFFVTSGWLMPGCYPYGETDGPIGAAILGRALALAFGARMVVLTEAEMLPCTTAACRAAGLNVLTEGDIARAPRPPHPNIPMCIIVPIPIPLEAAQSEAKRLFDTYDPKAILSMEKNGPNAEGKYCMVGGDDNSDCVIKAAEFFYEAERRGVLTIGIGDRGNEIGFGAIAEVPRRVLPFGEQATDNTTVDVLVTAAVSNWGASAIAASLAAMLDRTEVMHDTDTESRMLHRCIDAGGVDGFGCTPIPVTDGMREPVHVGICALLNEIVRAPAVKSPSVFATPLHKKDG
jgi:D-glutamate cyclase